LSLDEASRILVFEPLGVTGLGFRPLGGRHGLVPDALSSTAPTEHCLWRKKVLWGEVHDHNAWALGGVAGHAGLFGSSRAVAQLLLRLLDVANGRLRVHSLPEELLEEFWRRQALDPHSTWALGFDTPARQGSTAGSGFSPASVGHLGFTGTSFWVDPQADTLAVFLCNRIFPRASEEGQVRMRAFRVELHELLRRFW
jgi:CubicO group peptidase (beta-lactamase class C family)